MRVAQFLTNQLGFVEVYNAEGGIAQYASDVDPSVGQY